MTNILSYLESVGDFFLSLFDMTSSPSGKSRSRRTATRTSPRKKLAETSCRQRREEFNRNRIAVQDLPEYTVGPCKKTMRTTKVEVSFPYLQRSDVFYNKWRREEIKIFEKLYLKFSRSGNRHLIFETIANKLPNKTVAECIEYYYLFKKIRSFRTKKSKGRNNKVSRNQGLKSFKRSQMHSGL